MSYKPNIHIAGCVLKFELNNVRVELEIELDPSNILKSLKFVTEGIQALGAKDINHLPNTPPPAKTEENGFYAITCASCNKDSYVKFKPTRKGAVCNECYQRGKGKTELL